MRFIPAVLILFLLVSCKDAPSVPGEPGLAQRARDYNDRLVGLQSGLDSLRTALALSIAERNPAAARKILPAMEKSIEALDDSLGRFPDFEGDSSLKVAAHGVFGVYQAETRRIAQALPILFTEDAIDTLKYPDSLAGPDSLDPNAELIPAYERIMARKEKEQKIIDRFYEVQADFAERYGFRLALGRGED